MPKYAPTDEDMDSSEYGAEAAPGAGATPLEKPKTETPSVDEENASKSEILIAKKELPEGVKEGDTVTMIVKKSFGDEYSLQVVDKDNSPDTETESTPEADFAEMDQESEV